MELNKIVVGVDFGEESEVAVRQALELARHRGAELVLLHVGAIPEEPVGVPESMLHTADVFREELAARLRSTREELERMRERMSGQGAEVSHMVIEGFPDTAICSAVEELKASMVVVGTHGATGVKRFLLGSVAERVVRLSSASVLVARPQRAGRSAFKKILVPTDFGPNFERVLDAAVSVAAKGAEIDLVYCWHLPLMASSYYAPATSQEAVVGPVRDGIVEAAEERAQKLIDQVPHGNITVKFDTVQAPPAYGIQERAEQGQYDLIVMGSHGRRGLRRWILGSVAEVTVRHAPCSVLVVHGAAEEAEA